MQAHLRSSLSNAESKDGDLGFIWFENFWWKYSHCKMSVLYSWFCRSPPAFCQGALLRGGSSEKENDLGEQASYQVGHCLPWPGLVWVRNLNLDVFMSTKSPACQIVWWFLCSAGKSRAFPSLCLKASELRTHKDSAREIFKIKSSLACRDHMSHLLSSLPSFPKTFSLRTSNSSYLF